MGLVVWTCCILDYLFWTYFIWAWVYGFVWVYCIWAQLFYLLVLGLGFAYLRVFCMKKKDDDDYELREHLLFFSPTFDSGGSRHSPSPSSVILAEADIPPPLLHSGYLFSIYFTVFRLPSGITFPRQGGL